MRNLLQFPARPVQFRSCSWEPLILSEPGTSPVLRGRAAISPASRLRETRAIPIVFIGASDPVGAGFIASFARPGGNITGFTTYEPSLGKWLATLKEIAPATVRAALMVNPDITFLQGRTYVPAFESAAAAISVEPVTAHVRSTGDIEAALDSLGQRPGGGLIVVPESFTSTHRELIVRLAAQHRVPAMYRQFPASGGVISYGLDNVDTFRRSAAYIDIMRGEKPAELPVQAPTNQPEDRQGARPESPGIVPGARRRGDRIDRATAHVALLWCMSPEVADCVAKVFWSSSTRARAENVPARLK